MLDCEKKILCFFVKLANTSFLFYLNKKSNKNSLKKVIVFVFVFFLVDGESIRRVSRQNDFPVDQKLLG
jgi:hypothetical protein